MKSIHNGCIKLRDSFAYGGEFPDSFFLSIVSDSGWPQAFLEIKYEKLAWSPSSVLIIVRNALDKIIDDANKTAVARQEDGQTSLVLE